MRSQSGQVDDAVNRAQRVIRWDVPFQAELVKQRLLRHSPSPIIASPLIRRQLNQYFTSAAMPTLSTQSPKADIVDVHYSHGKQLADRIRASSDP